MANDTQRVRVEELDWAGLFPVMRLFEVFRMAVHPPKLLLGLALVLLLWCGGQALDVLSGARVYPGELEQFVQSDPQAFEAWLDGRDEWSKGQLRRNLAGLEALDADTLSSLLDSPRRIDLAADRVREHLDDIQKRIDQTQEQIAKEVEVYEDSSSASGTGLHKGLSRLKVLRRDWRNKLGLIDSIRRRGVFDAICQAEANAFERTIAAAAQLQFGFGQLLSPDESDPDTVVGGLLDMGVGVPRWVWQRHCWFGLFYVVGALGVWSLFGGTICRVAALHATRDERIPAGEALRFTFARWGWFVLTPLIPLILVAALGLVLVLGGLIFNLPIFDIVGGMFFFVALLCGAGIAAIVLLQAAGIHIVYPALATEGTDAFDAISRAFGYVMNRPWQWLFYTLVALVYGAITYVVVTLLVFLTVWVTQTCVGWWVVRDAAQGLNRFEAIFPQVRFGQLSYELPWSQMSLAAKTTAVFVALWVHLVFATLGAFVVSFYFSANTWIYLLLRRSCDGTEVDDVYIEEKQDPEPVVQPSVSDTAKDQPAVTEPGGNPAPQGSDGDADQASSTNLDGQPD